jgi:hypothetical protein
LTEKEKKYPYSRAILHFVFNIFWGVCIAFIVFLVVLAIFAESGIRAIPYSPDNICDICGQGGVLHTNPASYDLYFSEQHVIAGEYFYFHAVARFWGGAFYEQLEAPDEITIVGPIFLSLVTIISTYVLARREIKKDMLRERKTENNKKDILDLAGYKSKQDIYNLGPQ